LEIPIAHRESKRNRCVAFSSLRAGFLTSAAEAGADVLKNGRGVTAAKDNEIASLWLVIEAKRRPGE
jgi:hypothetical protein